MGRNTDRETDGSASSDALRAPSLKSAQAATREFRFILKLQQVSGWARPRAKTHGTSAGLQPLAILLEDRTSPPIDPRFSTRLTHGLKPYFYDS